jgi:UDP-glucose 4-epimerase
LEKENRSVIMKVLIVGCEGFIGNNILNFLQKNNYEVLGCDLLDIKNSSYPYYKIDRFNPSYFTIIKESQPDVVINAAGSGLVSLSITNPLGDFQANTIDTFNLLEAIRLNTHSCKYLNFSSAAVYGNTSKIPVSEDDSIQPISPYGWHKYYSELICKEYFQLHHIKTLSVRPFSVYGPGLKKQLFWDMYQKTQNSKEITLFGTGKESRDFIFIEDFVKVIGIIFEKADFDGGVINIANGEETTIAEAASIFYSNLPFNGVFSFNGAIKEGDPVNWRADIRKLSAMGYSSSFSFEEGITQYIQWLKENA